jgi:hypothetical protein
MNNSIAMTADFDRQKNIQASLYTAGIAGALLLLVLFIKFYQPVVQTQPAEEFIEINLGSSDVGSGNDQPELPGEPAPALQVAYTPTQPVTNAVEESVKDIEENNDAEAAPIYKPTVTKTDAKKINEESKIVKPKVTTATATPTPAPPQPRAVMGQVRGGNGNGGNGASTYKPGTGEGQGGGAGDQGSIGGNPNGRSYTPRNLGVKMVSMPTKNFEDDFNESGKIVLDITVDENGKLLSATYQPRGSSISNRNQIQIAQKRARELSYPKYPGGFKQPHVFVFDVK